jgi:ADP-ribosylglycohydrolase
MSTLPPDHDARMERVRLSLDGLSVGDAFGASIFDPRLPDPLHRPRPLPLGPWRYTDDTVTALGIVEVLERHGRIDQDDLVQTFARHYWEDPNRGYGPTPKAIFEAMQRGIPWREAAVMPAGRSPGWMDRLEIWLGLRAAPSPPERGSRGNGAAMRVAPVGAYFADDVERAVAEARASAEVTHGHPDGIAGAVAVAVAAAWAWRCHAGRERHTREGMFDHVLAHTPDGPTRERLALARTLPLDIGW